MTIIAIPDLHMPWVDQKALAVAIKHIKDIKPDHIVQMGDLYDFYAFSSNHPTNRNVITPKNELANGRAAAESFWDIVHQTSPKSKLHQILGNHDLRIRKGIRKKAPEYECILDTLDFDSLWRFKHVNTIFDYREPLVLEGIVFHHGWLGHNDHMKKFLKPTVIGHLHVGQVTCMNLWDTTIWEMCTGFLGDRDSMVFNYTPTVARKWEQWTTGIGLVDKLGPRFIPIKV